MLNPSISTKVYIRDRYHCRHCNSTYGLHPHHVVFKSHQGKDVLNNLLTLCFRCHRAVHDGFLKIYVKGLTETDLNVRFKRVRGWKPQ